MDERRTTGRRAQFDSETNTGERRRTQQSSARPRSAGSTDERRRVQSGGSSAESRRRVSGTGEARRANTAGRSSAQMARGPRSEGNGRTARSTADVQRRRNTTGQRVAPSSSGRVSGPKKKKKKSRLGFYLLLFLIIILVIGLAGGAVLWKKYGPTKDTYDLGEYFGITSDMQAGITIDNEVIDSPAMKVDDHIYVSYETVRDYLNERFYWDPNENILLYTLPQAMVRVNVGSKDYTISKENKSEDYVILKTEGSTAYIALDFVQKYTNLEYKVYQKPDRVMIVSDWGEVTTAVVKRDTQVRYRGGVKSPVLAEVKKGDKLTTIESADEWKKVRTEDGLIGYVQNSKLRKETTETISREFEEEEFTSMSSDKTINLAWHQVTSQAANSSVLETIAKTKGLTTLSPTWFSVADNDGNLNSIASSDYVNYAHQAGIDVWGLVDNFGENIDQMELLSHTSARENLENQLISEALQSGIDGINVDFEKIPEAVGEHYIQFIRELSVKCRLNHLVLSVDNYVPKGYNTHYHRKEQGIVADYVIIMGYDEHFSGSYEAGSVASYNYVKEGIEETLKDVPAEKVINAVPFYTRLWSEVPKTEEELAEQQGTEAGEYAMKVSSEALGMQAAKDRVSQAGVEAEWDDTVKQNYAEWVGSDGVTYKIWLEDASSLEAKLQLMKDNRLAGTAAWKLGFETSDIWELILKYVN